ncbi:MAG TPA: hypothetical protein VI030_06235 [Propionibacteriaceae bacterium]
MLTPLLIPLEGGFDRHHGPPWAAGEPSAISGGEVPHFEPFLGGLMFFLFMLLVLGTLLFFLVRHGHLGSLSLTSNPSPEADAKKILAERFARGDITSDEFMERASVLNWTPGSDSWDDRKGKKKR